MSCFRQGVLPRSEDAFSEYVLEPTLSRRLESEGLDAPPPFDDHPDFPRVIFRYEDDSPCLHAPGDPVSPVVAQIVPDADNRYVVKFQNTEPVVWHSAWNMYQVLMKFDHPGQEVVVHPRVHGIPVVGISRGYSRFVVGIGISVFVQQVIGPVPDGVPFGSVVSLDMVAVLACEVPGIDDASLTFHIMPAEYVSDPPLPRFLLGYSPLDLAYWLPPPPFFSQGSLHGGNAGYRYAKVRVGISAGERAEGGGFRLGGGVSFDGIVERGVPYLLLHGHAV